MTAPDLDTAAAPAAANHTHLVCCNPNRGLCREDVSAAADMPDATILTCSVCDLIDEAGSTCGAPLCRLRQLLRQYFGRLQ